MKKKHHRSEEIVLKGSSEVVVTACGISNPVKMCFGVLMLLCVNTVPLGIYTNTS